ncbi:MAG: type II toxin-antitoxin system PemK/MazF family toxin [Syntrophorhabdaceae bacterium]|nr:type II toxin-antitoxin system PemK/MazF family toxin [Syntrophorhabdaceae bacterium]MDD5243055.1 type II toxin-antitoxin system PemK/MazF family toxin [Syntrophorhabdaceae bacterium]
MSIKIVSRGEVWLVNFDPTIGSEINKKRPAVIVSSDALGILPVYVVVPITDWKERYAKNFWHIKIVNDAANGLDKMSAVDVLQIRSVSIDRLTKKIGKVSSTMMEEIVAAIAAVIEYQ